MSLPCKPEFARDRCRQQHETAKTTSRSINVKPARLPTVRIVASSILPWKILFLQPIVVLISNTGSSKATITSKITVPITRSIAGSMSRTMVSSC